MYDTSNGLPRGDTGAESTTWLNSLLSCPNKGEDVELDDVFVNGGNPREDS
jgi:hypothetical protein